MPCSISAGEALRRVYSWDNITTATGCVGLTLIGCSLTLALLIPRRFSVLAAVLFLIDSIACDKVYKAIAFIGALVTGRHDVFLDSSGVTSFALVRCPFLACAVISLLRFGVYVFQYAFSQGVGVRAVDLSSIHPSEGAKNGPVGESAPNSDNSARKA